MAAPFKVESLVNKIEVDYDANGNPIYYGVAIAGALTSDPKWRIAKIAYIGNNPVEVTYADGTVEYNHIWDNRLAYTYS